MWTKKKLLHSALVLALLLPSTSFAVDDTARGAARDLGYEGVKAYQAGDYEIARDKLDRAYAVLQAPSLGLWSARALEKSGLLVEASERYLAAIRADLVAGGDREVQERAQQTAKKERTALLPRIPKLTVDVVGGLPESVVITVGDRKLATPLVGTALPTNPGEITITVATENGEKIRTVDLPEGATEKVVFQLATSAEEPVVTDSGDSNPAVPRDDPPARWPKPVGWALTGTGGGLLAMGIVTGVLGQGKYDELDCPDGVCPPGTDEDEVQAANTLRDLSMVGFIAGGVLTATGVTLLLTAPKSKSTAYVAPYIGGLSAGVKGRF